MKYNRLLLCVLLLFSLSALSQPIQLRSGTIQKAFNIERSVIDSFNTSAKRVGGQSFAVLQFTHIPTGAEQKTLLANGITLLDYLPENSYTVSIKGNLSMEALHAAGTKSVFQLLPRQKMQDYFSRGIIPAWAVKVAGTVDVWISFPKTLSAQEVIAELKKANIEILSEQHLAYRILALRIASSRLQEIAAFPFIEYIQPSPFKPLPPLATVAFSAFAFDRTRLL